MQLTSTQFNYNTVRAKLAAGGYCQPEDTEAAVYVSGVMQYVAEEVLTASVEQTVSDGFRTISLERMNNGIEKNTSLRAFVDQVQSTQKQISP
ncbi:hypothetical protein BC940DRAFT_308032 [Gongronella butleri]|nr:hypothetical protein BC940DRAFT_308032 [Gongronella butleri]